MPTVPEYKWITKSYKEIERPYFVRWMDSCSDIPVDHWRTAPKKKKSTMVIVENETHLEKAPSFPIADMHDMQLVNSIKWCISLANKYITNSAYNNWKCTKAELLAQSPQWFSLLVEAKKRKLRMISNFDTTDTEAPWFIDAYTACVFKAMLA